MSVIDPNLRFDWKPLVEAPPRELLAKLAEAHSAIANLSLTVAFLRQEEVRGNASAKEQRLETEGLRDAYTELKWLCKTLLDHREES